MSGVLNIFVVSPDTRSERRIEPYWTVQVLKLSDNSKTLSEYGLRDWQVLKIEDTNPSTSFTGQLTDLSQVDKFELSETEYAKRQDSVLAFKKRNRVGRFAETNEAEDAAPQSTAGIEVGARCEVESTEPGLSKRGTVRYVGQTKFSKGVWVGIEYDEPLGKNDGSVQGERYFACRPSYGVFARPDRVRVGDYPELDLEAEEM
ncbi:hypothetical protein AGABI2DRAFT_143504 [Agaricus bisporus var. bisporus H97]|uniref:hypothetical protein n=1 Tax=Agaricus bisporus var. bisporus (strain H97 / ATCC MYA-4626 / FGSC 10389) TaxID=936046 RepID=UPI00029F5ADE|nr:hypothetical protein AGABI2DRAFT_143504 [Agaricus bisporus var. bisporus H97]EKV46364.1 hypothetical protein AGABI2DRAFT_143504 [Agaricus bisporus var. bisporus H97]